jgi:peptidoglycan hydrolase CwlO-like protein
MWTINMIKSQALLSNKSVATIEQLNVLNYLPSWDQSLLSNLEEEIQQQKIYNDAKSSLDTFKTHFDRAVDKINEYKAKKDVVSIFALVNSLQLMEGEIIKVSNIPDSLVKERNDLINTVGNQARKTMNEIPALASATVTK